ncbi:lysophospholipid acyltransferase family protein [Nioella aestuarii]|uniref:lysophospholipid acyltransferase family protein n=1 Tax=Nioella aestuarii TaxID=1662864 RepID=UPI003D7FF74A
MSLRSRIINGPGFFFVMSSLLSGWMRFVAATSRIDRKGWAEVEEAIGTDRGVIICCWHQRIMMSPFLMPGNEDRCNSLTSHKRPGRIVGQMLKRFGFKTTPLPPGTMGTSQMRSLLGGLRQGISICMSPDGSSGPAFECKIVPIQWARASGVPIFVFTFSCKRSWALPTWDRMMLPLPFNRMTLQWQKWDRQVPRQSDDFEALRIDLQGFMNDQVAELDAVYGRNP